MESETGGGGGGGGGICAFEGEAVDDGVGGCAARVSSRGSGRVFVVFGGGGGGVEGDGYGAGVFGEEGDGFADFGERGGLFGGGGAAGCCWGTHVGGVWGGVLEWLFSIFGCWCWESGLLGLRFGIFLSADFDAERVLRGPV